MREVEKDLFRLKHILAAIENVNNFMVGKECEDLTNDSILYYAVVKNIEIVGEASYMLTAKYKELHPNTPCKLITKMRHILVHGYYQIEAEQLYNVYTEDLPMLQPQIEQYIRDYPQ